MIRKDKIESKYRRILERTKSAARQSGRSEGEVKIVVVTKGQGLDKVRAVIDAGARWLGENYAEEGAEKLKQLSRNQQLQWHMIGHIQSRKAEMVCEHYDFVHSLDRLKIARRLNRYSEQFDRQMPVLIECNMSGEPSKYGFDARDEKNWDALLPTIEKIIQLPRLEIRGLMTMPPYFDDPEKARPYFVKLRNLRGYLSRRYPKITWEELSMGMSTDFEIAIQEGATIIRVGQAILGPRGS